MTGTPFWKSKSLSDMSSSEWESLCDGCGRCCLHKIEDIDTGDIAFTNVSCRYLDLGSCQCSDYKGRQRNVSDCVELAPKNIRSLKWLPETCAYRLLDVGKDLYWWHPLVSGKDETVHDAGISVRRKAISEDDVEDIEDYVQEWLREKPDIFDRS